MTGVSGVAYGDTHLLLLGDGSLLVDLGDAWDVTSRICGYVVDYLGTRLSLRVALDILYGYMMYYLASILL
jgi:hypothetical protein